MIAYELDYILSGNGRCLLPDGSQVLTLRLQLSLSQNYFQEWGVLQSEHRLLFIEDVLVMGNSLPSAPMKWMVSFSPLHRGEKRCRERGLTRDHIAGRWKKGDLNSTWLQSPRSLPCGRGCWGHCSTFPMVPSFPASNVPMPSIKQKPCRGTGVLSLEGSLVLGTGSIQRGLSSSEGTCHCVPPNTCIRLILFPGSETWGKGLYLPGLICKMRVKTRLALNEYGVFFWR